MTDHEQIKANFFSRDNWRAKVALLALVPVDLLALWSGYALVWRCYKLLWALLLFELIGDVIACLELQRFRFSASVSTEVIITQLLLVRFNCVVRVVLII